MGRLGRGGGERTRSETGELDDSDAVEEHCGSDGVKVVGLSGYVLRYALAAC